MSEIKEVRKLFREVEATHKGIRQRGNSFLVDVTVDGVRKTAKCDSMDEAKTIHTKLKAQLLNTVEQADYWALAEAAEKCHVAIWNGLASESGAVRNIQSAIDFFGANTLLDEIQGEWIDAYIARLKQIGNSNATVNRKLSALSRVISFAHQRGKVKAKPYMQKQKESQGRIRFLTQEEEMRSLAYLSQWGKDDHAEAFCVLVDTGLRPGELWRVESRDVHMGNNVISIWQTKNGEARSVPMTQRVREIIARRMPIIAVGPLFPFDNDWMQRAWDRLRHAMQLADDKQFVVYALRHTCASRLVQRGVPLLVVKDWLGHKGIQVTIRYAHLSPTNLMEAVRVLEAC